MALDTYDGLQAEIASWVNRGDLTTRIPTFIAMAESRLNRDSRLRTRQAVATESVVLVTGSAVAGLPAEFGDLININHTDATCKAPMESRTLQQLDKVRAIYTAQRPLYYAINGAELEIAPLPDADYTVDMTYYRRIPALSTSLTTNWLLAAAGDIYLQASLVNAWQFLLNTEDAAGCEARLQQMLDAYKRDSDLVEAGGAPTQIIGEPIGGAYAY